MTEQTGLMDKPKKIWNGALKMVKGENTTQLIEQFTAEMTLVAEGLCEDQNKLHRDVDRMMTDQDSRVQKLEARIALLEKTMEEEREARDRELTETRNRLASLEKKTDRTEKETAARVQEKRGKGTLIRNLTILIGIAGGSWVLVTLLNLIRDIIR